MPPYTTNSASRPMETKLTVLPPSLPPAATDARTRVHIDTHTPTNIHTTTHRHAHSYSYKMWLFEKSQNGRTSTKQSASLAMFELEMRKIGIIRRDMKAVYDH